MALENIILDNVQAGLETVRGTQVAATRKLYATARTMSYERTLSSSPSATGTFQGRRFPSQSRATGGMGMTAQLTYESAPWWFYLCMSGTVAATSDGGSPAAYTRTFDLDLDTDTLDSATLEGIGKQTPYLFLQGMVNEWNLRWDSDSTSDPEWQIETNWLTLAPQPSAVTAGVLDRSETAISARGTKVYIDDVTMGSTQRTGMAISGSVSGNNNLVFPAYAENESGPPANKVIRGEATVDAQLVLSFQNDDDFADFRSDTPVQRKIRLERSAATAIHDTTFPRMRLDLYGYWSAIAWGDRNGERTVTLSLMTFYDVTAAASAIFSFVNNLADPLP